MLYYSIKIAVTVVVVIAVSEVTKRSSVAGAILASVPLVSLLAIVWIYIETKDLEKISSFASEIVWLVLPSLAFFIALPVLLKHNVHFFLSVGISTALTVGCYLTALWITGYLNLKF